MAARTGRLEGLDLARFLAFAGMVIVNFKIAMGAEGQSGFWAAASGALEGRAAALFVVLAGIGLGLAQRGATLADDVAVIVKRALFLLAVGLVNMLIFPADILHYYAFYFLFGAFMLRLNAGALGLAILGLNLAFVLMILFLDYDAGWNWTTYDYADFWTPRGFIRNLFFNGWHPVIPWLGFLLFGILLSRLPLQEDRLQKRLIGGGALALAGAEGLRLLIEPALAKLGPEMPILAQTSPVPPAPLYSLAGMGAAALLIGLSLKFMSGRPKRGAAAMMLAAGRQSLTLYIAHILIGMGALEALGMLGGQTVERALLAAFLFCALAMIYAGLWARAFKRGPVEALMRRLAG